MTLSDLNPGSRALIHDIGSVDDLLRRRLIDLGVMEGTEIVVRRSLPFGGPLTLEAGGQWIGLRRRDAACIQVTPA